MDHISTEKRHEALARRLHAMPSDREAVKAFIDAEDSLAVKCPLGNPDVTQNYDVPYIFYVISGIGYVDDLSIDGGLPLPRIEYSEFCVINGRFAPYFVITDGVCHGFAQDTMTATYHKSEGNMYFPMRTSQSN